MKDVFKYLKQGTDVTLTEFQTFWKSCTNEEKQEFSEQASALL